ncbi:MAG: class I tRNA ligase family protein, partial [Clostridia bacterium]
MADFRSTLNLPRTDFAMRAGLPREEPKRLQAWQNEGVYERLLEERRGQPRFVLHDGPPYANGDIHMGTALNKVLKDIVNRYHLLLGEAVHYVPGYDTHGLPIEMQALKTLGVSQHQMDPVELRRESARTAAHFMGVMTEQFQRLGVLGDWQHPYATMHPDFEAAELRLFAGLVDQDLVYKDLKSVHWCPVCETALAEAELEYQTITSPSIWVAFDVIRDPQRLLPAKTRAVIWTTTPWTIPANVAIAYNPDLPYQVVDGGAGPLLVAASLIDDLAQALGMALTPVGDPLFGRELSGIVARHPYLDREAPLVAGGHVTDEQGTGLVHTAPGHGEEDFEVGRLFHLPVIQPLDDRGRFEPDTPHVGGMFYQDANDTILEVLKRSGHLLAAGVLEHQYAHCWRSKNPVIFRATRQWFMRIGPIRQAMLDAVDAVRWVPEWGHDRMRNMIVDRADWCISRQRSWGLPIPAFSCTACGADVLDADFVRRFAARVEQDGSTVWWTAS